jgi:YVTN family beta-propeller protein
MTVSRLAIALLLSLALSTQTNARGTGYVFVSNEQTNTVAVIDSRHEDQVIKWIKTSRRPRGMVFRDDRKQLLVACGKDNVIDVIDVATLAVIDHIPTGTNPEVFELSHDQNALYISNSEKSAVQEIGLGDRSGSLSARSRPHPSRRDRRQPLQCVFSRPQQVAEELLRT